MTTAVLLTANQAADELNIESWHVNRAIARGVLEATKVGGDEWRITSAAIEAAASSNDLEGPSIFQGWIDIRAEKNRADRFVSQVKAAIIKRIPEEDPGRDQVIPFGGEIARLAAAAVPDLAIKIRDSRELPYTTMGQVFIAARLSEKAQLIVRRAPFSGNIMKRTNGIDRFYASPEVYQQFVDEAWVSLMADGIAVEEGYPSVTPGRPTRRRFTFRIGSITGVSKTEIARLVF